MQRQMLKSKIHRATVTDCDLDYVGSITIDPELMAKRRPDRQRAGARLGHRQRRPLRHLRDRGRARLREVQVNGAAARLVSEGDKVIVASFGAYDERDLEAYSPVVVHVDDRNAIVEVDSHPEVLLGLAARLRRPGAS